MASKAFVCEFLKYLFSYFFLIVGVHLSTEKLKAKRGCQIPGSGSYRQL